MANTDFNLGKTSSGSSSVPSLPKVVVTRADGRVEGVRDGGWDVDQGRTGVDRLVMSYQLTACDLGAWDAPR